MRISEVFLREKRVQNALGNVFLVQKRLQNVKKISASGGHIVIEIRLVMSLKCIFFAPAAGIIVFLCFMLVYRALLHKH